ncbi:MAG: translation initiation factor IF-2 [bacterium]
MNVTELARILKITPAELRQYLPQMGFDVGLKAIKVDNQTAKKIISAWHGFKHKLDQEKAEQEKEEIIKSIAEGPKKKINIPPFISVKQFSEISGIAVNKLLAELMKNGVFASINERIDFDTAAIVGSDFGLEIVLDKEKEQTVVKRSERLRKVLSEESADTLEARPPVIVVMGHVDHGKTKLLDAIRKTNIIDTEAGGITQQIGAYQVKRKGRAISFVDTPGHEAFTAMRNRGAKIADIAILVVAADDGVKPQTIEAFRIIESAKIPYIVAINKIDKPEADIEKTKQELSNKLNIVPEDWGGKIICVPISAKQGENIDELLDMVLLTADMEEDSLKANPNTKAIGTVIESNVDKGEGVIATVLVQNGTLKIGDNLVCNGKAYGKVRALKNYLGKNIESAKPSTPVKLIGFKVAPEVGDIIEVGNGEKMKRIKTIAMPGAQNVASQEKESSNGPKINLIIKSDTLGSGEAIEASLAKLDTMGVKIKILHKGLGNITEGDITRADASNAKLVGFNVQAFPHVEEMARESNVNINIYQIIYELLNDLKAEIQSLVQPDIKRIDLGRIKVLAIFKTDKKEQIIGGKVTLGTIKPNSLIEVMRDNEIIARGRLTQLQSGRQDVDMIEENGECGIKYEGPAVIKINDRLQVYQEEAIYHKVK